MNILAAALVAILLGLLTGCASTPPAVPGPAVSIPRIPDVTWRRIDRQIWEASVSARSDAEDYARSAVRHWANKVWEQTEREFIPWYADYWTQQWLFLKLAWYQTSKGSDSATNSERLAIHLEEQFYTRVLKPVAQETDPDRIADQTASVYTKVLASQIRVIPDRLQIPVAAFNEKLKEIPAIELSNDPPRNATLYQILNADILSDIPAYQAFAALNQAPGNGIESSPARNKLDAVARQAADKLAEKIAMRGGGAAAAALAGGGIGIVISAGITAWGIAEHEKRRPALEAELRDNLMSALRETSRILLENPEQGVMAATQHMSSHIENHVFHAPVVDHPTVKDPAENRGNIDALF